MLGKSFTIFVLLIGIYFEIGTCYSAIKDAPIIKNLRLNATRSTPVLNHAKIARKLVHQASWASVGTISVNSNIKDYPMVNVISVDDSDSSGVSTGDIRFLLTDLDFTGSDFQQNNNVSFLFSDQQLLYCSNPWHDIDPMEPTCARTIISGQIEKMDKSSKNYDEALKTFVKRHPAAENWLKSHNFYLCKLNIINIFVFDFYGPPHNVSPAKYYNIQL